MRRYWIDPKNISENRVTIEGEEFHHIFDVCRQDKGSQFEVLGLPDKAIFVQVTEVQKKKAYAQVLETRMIAPLAKPHLVLALSISRYPVMDAVVEKAVEMGVSRIVPFVSELSFIRKAENLPPNKADRWQKIVKSATQQSGRAELMRIDDPVTFDEVFQHFNRTPGALGLFAYEGKATQDIKTYLHANSSKLPSEIWLFVGSEGGFSPTEVQQLESKNLISVTLGAHVLRVETACIALLAVLKYEFNLMCLPGGKNGLSG
jgi:16S rRNA (uracil1498-N3)-methyltransferase